jgi:FG-GAP-like repeat/FG-GAP repeat
MWWSGEEAQQCNAFHKLAIFVASLVALNGCNAEEAPDIGIAETPLTTGTNFRDERSAAKWTDSLEIIAPLPGATKCTTPGQCPSGFCVDGVCCDTACTATCQACAAAKKGSGIDGVCGFITNATDPDNDCPFGDCNGTGSCAKSILFGNGSACTTGAQCSSSFCVDGVCCNSTCTATCQACTAAKKGSGSDGTCGDIAPATDPDNECVASDCNGSGACGANPGMLPNGTACLSKGTCLSGNCIDGVCCDSPCAATCKACTTAKKGGGANGVCGDIAVATDPDNECAFGNCNGLGACGGSILLGNGVACSSAGQCSSGFCTDGVCCNNACTGTCLACTAAKKGSGTNGTCGVIANATDPDNECATGDCNGAGACTSGGPSPDGSPCSSGATCNSGFCVDGVCCNNFCSGTCEACTAAKVGSGVDGHCWFVGAGLDPDNECPMVCNGSGACNTSTGTLPNGTICSFSNDCLSGNCVDGVCCDAPCGGVCQSCKANWKNNGTPDGVCGFIKKGTDPQSECTNSSCNGVGGCQFANGFPCAVTTDCESLFCVDGVCCNSACSGLCVACSAAKKGEGPEGTCGYVATSTNPDNECATSCNGLGTCTNTLPLAPLGSACTVDAQCGSGFCTDGVCCNGSCSVSCKACNVAGQIGTCSEIFPGSCAGQCSGELGLPNIPWLTQTAPLVAGDLNGDGRDDLIVGNYVFRARGSGAFEPPLSYPYLAGGVKNLVDVDGDGDRDLITLGGAYLYVVKNVGNGTFSGKTVIPLNDAAYDADAADFNGDGLIDIVTTQTYASTVTVHINQGNGFYAAGVDYAGYAASNVAAADMDGDGDNDLVLMNTSTFRILKNQGNGSFVVGTTTNSMYGHYATLATADIDGDGDTDILMTDIEYCGVRAQLNPGNGAYPSNITDIRLCTTFKYDHPLTVADFNGDGKPDLFYGFGDTWSVGLKLNLGGTQLYNVGEVPGALAAGDFDGDGDMDGAVANWNSRDVSILLNNGAGVFQNNAIPTIVTSSNNLMIGADVNGDGIMDIVGTKSSGIDVRIGLGNAAFNAPVAYSTSSGPSTLVAGDVNGDGKPDLAVAHGSSLAVGIMMNQGNGTYGPEVYYQTGWYPRGVALEDVNGDNNRDLIVGSFNTVTVHMNQGTGTFGNPDTYNIGSYSEISVLDFNGDGWSDIVVSPSANGGLSLLGTLINQGNGSFVRGADIPVAGAPAKPHKVDFNGDGLFDLLVPTNTYAMSVLHNNGNGTFAGQSIALPESAIWTLLKDIVTGDMNRDGLPDIIFGFSSANSVGSINVFINQGNGSFSPRTHYASGALGESLIPADFNGDGHTDIAYGTTNGIGIAINTCIP